MNDEQVRILENVAKRSEVQEEVDEYGNTEDELRYCCFPDCGCDGARNCMAPSGPNTGSYTLNREAST